mmetsp:Transcript_698/g.2814  ORF Transcript_698/g.2814 Transcript_698/m.2814 type:complete len:334 (-) Transcript_698:1336-2337(-)
MLHASRNLAHVGHQLLHDRVLSVRVEKPVVWEQDHGDLDLLIKIKEDIGGGAAPRRFLFWFVLLHTAQALIEVQYLTQAREGPRRGGRVSQARVAQQARARAVAATGRTAAVYRAQLGRRSLRRLLIGLILVVKTPVQGECRALRVARGHREGRGQGSASPRQGSFDGIRKSHSARPRVIIAQDDLEQCSGTCAQGQAGGRAQLTLAGLLGGCSLRLVEVRGPRARHGRQEATFKAVLAGHLFRCVPRVGGKLFHRALDGRRGQHPLLIADGHVSVNRCAQLFHRCVVCVEAIQGNFSNLAEAPGFDSPLRTLADPSNPASQRASLGRLLLGG